MMISTRLEALRSLFVQQAKVAILSSKDDFYRDSCMEQFHLATSYAQAYCQNYRAILWLDARSTTLLRLSSLHACQRLGVCSGNDPFLRLQKELAKPSQLAPVLCIIEHADAALLNNTNFGSAQHFLVCCDLTRLSSDKTDYVIYAPPAECLLEDAIAAQRHTPAALASQWQSLTEASRQLLANCAYLGPLPLPMSCLPLLNDHTPLDLGEQVLELLQKEVAERVEWRDSAGNAWPCLMFSPALQQWQRHHLTATSLTTSQASATANSLLLLQSAFSNVSQSGVFLNLLHRHLEYFLLFSGSSDNHCATLLLQLEAHYQHLPLEGEALLRRVMALLPTPCNEEQQAPYFACRNLLAQNLKQQGNLDEAQELLIASLQSATEILGEADPQTCFFMSNLARLCAQRGQHLAAIELGHHAMLRLRSNLPDTHPHVQAVLHNLASSLQQVVLDEKGEALLQELVEIQLRVFGECDQRSQALMDQLAGHFSHHGNLQQAVHWMARVLAVRKQLFGARHVETSIAAYELMCLHCEREEGVQASRVFHEHLAWLRKANLEKLHPEQQEIRTLLLDFSENTLADQHHAGNTTLALPHILH